jgi:hypothetical protein
LLAGIRRVGEVAIVGSIVGLAVLCRVRLMRLYEAKNVAIPRNKIVRQLPLATGFCVDFTPPTMPPPDPTNYR